MPSVNFAFAQTFPKQRPDAASTAQPLYASSSSPDYPSARQILSWINRSKITPTQLEEEHVEELRKTSQPHNADNRQQRDNTETSYEPGLSVPNSVLDECQDSFVAADEKQEKASTQFFKDTGLMALLCRHDRVLFLANMTTAGEKQYYAFALLKELFDHLPANVTVGILYDIGCTIH